MPLLDYLSLILQTVKVSTDLSQHTAQYLGQLDDSEYVQSNPEASPEIYATLKFPSQYIPVSHAASWLHVQSMPCSCIMQLASFAPDRAHSKSLMCMQYACCMLAFRYAVQSRTT